MGRKRTGKDKGSAKEKDSLATADSVEATEQTCTSPEPEDPTTPTHPQLSNSAHSEDLSVAEQLKVAQQEIESMKAQLAAKDVEIASLRASQGLVSSANPSDSNRNAEMNKLRDRLSSLKREQQEADSAREAAWRQLKDVVTEISRLAAPPTDIARTPTAMAPAVPVA